MLIPSEEDAVGSLKKSRPVETLCSNSYGMPIQQSPSTHFFYFLRLMQLFPDTHPATLHTVLTLSKSNFFLTIDKLLYAQKCKSDLKRKLTSMTGRGRGFASRQSYPRASQSQRYQSLSRTVSNDLAEVKRIIDMAEKPFLSLHAVESTSETACENQEFTNEVVDICVENSQPNLNTEENVDGSNNHELIKIVCYNNDQTVLKQDQNSDAMQIETFDENVENLEPSINEDMSISKMDEDLEPPVIIVSTMEDSGDDCSADDHLEPSHVNARETINFTNVPN
ncbi:uncharacterized protein LOC109535940 [Dendroctonus ponderosae]|uniref:uncharacterized protein LOC109535940 n=1 Tax=Dendroctonus ponderosae TaxID=77166 RepID=UPI002036240F|nr:uncharacterized protein LOC109535940 [Dendroctonus ponderosae]